METDMIPKFSSKDEEIDFWKALSLKYKKRYVTGSCGQSFFLFFGYVTWHHCFELIGSIYLKAFLRICWPQDQLHTLTLGIIHNFQPPISIFFPILLNNFDQNLINHHGSVSFSKSPCSSFSKLHSYLLQEKKYARDLQYIEKFYYIDSFSMGRVWGLHEIVHLKEPTHRANRVATDILLECVTPKPSNRATRNVKNQPQKQPTNGFFCWSCTEYYSYKLKHCSSLLWKNWTGPACTESWPPGLNWSWITCMCDVWMSTYVWTYSVLTDQCESLDHTIWW